MMGAVHMQITTIGLDIAKNVFQVHGIDGNETVVVRKQLRRGKLIAFFESLAPCLVGIEACATAHHWAREPDDCKPSAFCGRRPYWPRAAHETMAPIPGETSPHTVSALLRATATAAKPRKSRQNPAVAEVKTVATKLQKIVAVDVVAAN